MQFSPDMPMEANSKTFRHAQTGKLFQSGLGTKQKVITGLDFAEWAVMPLQNFYAERLEKNRTDFRGNS